MDTSFQFKCCGANGPTDYSGSKWEQSAMASHTGRVPQSCCIEGSSLCTQKFILISSTDVYQEV